MPNIAAVLRDEIVRLARKEIRQQTEKLRRGAIQHRKSIATLNQTVRDLQRQLALATAHARKASSASTPEAIPSRVRFTATGLRSLRKRLDLSADSFGRLVGVSAQTIYNWERGVTRPSGRQLPALASSRLMGKREARRQLESAKKAAPR